MFVQFTFWEWVLYHSGTILMWVLIFLIGHRIGLNKAKGNKPKLHKMQPVGKEDAHELKDLVMRYKP